MELSDWSKVGKNYEITHKYQEVCVKAKITKGHLETHVDTLNDHCVSFLHSYNFIIATNQPESSKSIDLDEFYNGTEEGYLELKTFIKDYMYELSKQEKVELRNSVSCSNTDSPSFRAKLPPIP
ncbi:hypothetical protein FQA39_LY08263 [Lamprigera yunnana]|nr:hypothetical protein FQA39_LY08263 [Lamprigera yunnana]